MAYSVYYISGKGIMVKYWCIVWPRESPAAEELCNVNNRREELLEKKFRICLGQEYEINDTPFIAS